ncbi:MAG TPA: tetratricopeptide repeat protein, partial [Chitinophagales bacterium]|nr:tetratricopeptide repeat protein [Chitinophagales bacterium]
ETHFIMASQAHRLTKSACYKKSQMTCTTCHNPHKSVRQTDPSIFNAKCQNCHAQTNNNTHAENNCSLPLNQRTATNNNNCFACHMPVSPSIDIPHVTVHDHFIRKPISEAEKQKVQHFIGLKSVLSPNNTQALTKAKAYIHFYESYQAKKSHLDSAALFMEIATKSHQPQQQYPDYLDTQVHLYYLQQKFTELINIAQNTSPKTIKNAWTAYRLGEAYLQTNQPQLALNWLQQAVSLLPLQPDFDSKLAATQVQLSQFDAAKTRLEALLKEHPHHTASLSNLGFVYASTGNLPRADSLYHAALACNPNYVPAMLNLAGLELLKRNNTAALKYAQQALKAQPNNTQAQQLVQQLRGKL